MKGMKDYGEVLARRKELVLWASWLKAAYWGFFIGWLSLPIFVFGFSYWLLVLAMCRARGSSWYC